jgi:protein gp37
MASDAYWKQPLAWNRKAEREGRRIRVFCGSTCDVFEDRPELIEPWERLWKVIEETDSLDWLLLTKRPHVMDAWVDGHPWHSNAWAGVTVEDQERADERIPLLLQVPARIRFLSMEPLLGPVGLTSVTYDGIGRDALRVDDPGTFGAQERHLDWVIVGGESGPHARPMHPDWVRGIRDQCQAAGVPFFFKGWNGSGPGCVDMCSGVPVFDSFHSYEYWVCKAGTHLHPGDVCMDAKGRICKIGADFMRARDEGTFPVTVLTPKNNIANWKSTSRLLDGRTWEDVPR